MRRLLAARNALLAVGMAGVLMGLLVACTSSAPATPVATVAEVAPTDAPTVEPAVEPTVAATAVAAEEPTSNEATLVVQLDGSRTLIRKVDFTAPISGLALLEQSDLNVVTSELSWGTAVCSIEGVGCPAEDCFCSENQFWGYLSWQNGAWAGYPVGPGQSVISTTGAVEGWQWGNGATPPAPLARAEAADKALTWVRGQQTITDGSYASSVAPTLETLFALGANHEDAAEWRATPDAPSVLDFVLAHGVEFSQQGVSEAGKLAVALSAVDACWPAGALKPSDYYSPTLGAFHSDAGFLVWGILGTLALDEPVPTDSVDYLLSLALPEGGWEWSPGWGRDTNSTALALQALVAAGTSVTNSAVISGEAYLQAAAVPEGGFGYDPNASWGNVADSNSTAYVLQALAALGVDAPEEAFDFLMEMQGDDGALGWQREMPAPNLGSTQQAVPALLGQPYPIRRVVLPLCE